MSAPRRCLICGTLNEPYAGACSCGASLEISAEDSRDALTRRSRTAAWTLVLWAIVAVVLVGVLVALVGATGGAGRGRVLGGLVLGVFGAIAGVVRESRALFRARVNLAAIPELPRAEVRRRR